MNERADNTGHDKELEEYLAGSSAVSRRYREIGADEVPAELDQLVLQRARAAVARPTRAQAWRRWSVPVALAASVVLVVAILVEPGVQEQGAMLSSQAPAPAAAPPAAAEAERKSEIARDESGPAQLQSAVPVEPVTDDFAKIGPQAPAAARPQLAIPTQQVTTTAKRAREVEAQESAAVAAVAPQAQLDVQPPSVSEQLSYSPPAQQPEGTSVDAAAAKERNAQELQEVVVTGMTRPAARAGAGPRNTIPARSSYNVEEAVVRRVAQPAAASAAAASQASAAGSTSALHDDPVRWLEEIRQLRKDGKTNEADQEWQRFRAAFPDYAVAESDLARPKR